MLTSCTSVHTSVKGNNGAWSCDHLISNFTQTVLRIMRKHLVLCTYAEFLEILFSNIHLIFRPNNEII